MAAKRKLADLSLGEIVRQPLIDPSRDDVSRLRLDTYDAERFQTIQSMAVGEFGESILDDATTEEQLKQLQSSIVPEVAAAVAKIMSNKDLILAAAKIGNITRCRNAMGKRGVLGIRVQHQVKLGFPRKFRRPARIQTCIRLKLPVSDKTTYQDLGSGIDWLIP